MYKEVSLFDDKFPKILNDGQIISGYGG